MSWGGAPPWVYKEEIALAQSQTSKSEKLTIEQTDENLKCQKKIRDIKAELVKYLQLKSNNETSVDKIEPILDKIKKIVMNE